MATMKYWQAINRALHEELARDETVCVLGEDVAAPGGAFGATRGLLDAFGPQRVRDTPISEATIVGAAVGAAMSGLRPVVEVMFFDFMTLAMDQLVNQAAKVRYMADGRYHAPLVVRTVCGSGRSTGPQHSQSLESWLAHTPGLKVAWSSSPEDARGLLKAAIRDDDPVVVIESLSLWGARGEVEVGDDPPPPGVARTRRPGSDATVVTWGAATVRVLEAAAQLADNGVDVEVIDLRWLSPLDTETVVSSVLTTGRLVVVHDAVGPFGAGAEVAAVVAEQALDALVSPIVRVAAPFAPAPFPPHLERAYLPQADDVIAAVHRTLERTRD